MSIRHEEIAIIGAGAWLPGARGCDRLFENLLQGRTEIRDLCSIVNNRERPDFDLLRSLGDKDPDGTYSTMGAVLDRDEMAEVRRGHGLDESTTMWSHVMAIEVISQALSQLNFKASDLNNCDLFMGSPECVATVFPSIISTSSQRLLAESRKSELRAQMRDVFEKELERHRPLRPLRALNVSNLLETTRTHFEIGGSCFLLDAACASSLAALYVAIQRLRQGFCRFAVVAGVEESHGTGSMLVTFSRLGVLARKGSLPFDGRSDGVAIGDGAAAVIVTTRAEAERRSLPILALIKSIGGSCDGRAGGLTEPTVSGQLRAYRNCYGADEGPDLAYIECHGTGTKVGDRVELSSLSEFFKNRKVPIGSVKYNVGHTLAAAGGVALIKALGIIKHRTIPPSAYFHSLPNNANASGLYLNTRPIDLTAHAAPIEIGLSSFGFGGSNFHLWLSEYRPSSSPSSTSIETTERKQVVVCGKVEAMIEDVSDLYSVTEHPVPPKSWPWIDKIQHLTVLLAEKLFRSCGVRAADLDPERMHVIAGCAQHTELSRDIVYRVVQAYMYRLLSREIPGHREEFEAEKRRCLDSCVEASEQSLLGSLNILAGARAMKAFDFKGLNFTVDGDESSGLKALEIAREVLRENGGGALVYETIKVYDTDGEYLRNTGVRLWLLASLDFALDADFPIQYVLQPLVEEKIRQGSHDA